MRYMMMVFSEEAALARMSQEGTMGMVQEFGAFHEDVGKRGALQVAETVRVREGKTLTTDGPFAETKEQLGGVYVFECEDLHEAVEIRPVLEVPDGMWASTRESGGTT